MSYLDLHCLHRLEFMALLLGEWVNEAREMASSEG
jgi:hypothetical protein